MGEYISFCQDCKIVTEVVLDHVTGDTICSSCGLVLEERYIDETSEWRTFSNDASTSFDNSCDPNRVGQATDFLLMDAPAILTTQISNKPDGTKSDVVNRKLYAREQKPVLVLEKGFRAIFGMAYRLGLGEYDPITSRARQIYKNFEEQKMMIIGRKPRNMNSVYAACLFVACREDKKGRTLKEISIAAANGVAEKEISKAAGIIKKQQHLSTETVNSLHLVRRFCSNLGMSNRDMRAVQEAVQKSEQMDVRRKPKSLLAAIIYMISYLSEEKKIPLTDIAAAAEVAPSTIKKSYREVYLHASKLVPSWYAREEDIRRLCIL